MRKVKSWVASLDNKFYWSVGMQTYEACGRTLWKKRIEKGRDIMWRSSLVLDQCMTLFSRLTRMAKEIDGMSVEFGMFYGWVAHGHERIMQRCRWPYAAAAVRGNGYAPISGSLIVPCAGAAPRETRQHPVLVCQKLGWAPVNGLVCGKRNDPEFRVNVSAEQMARSTDVRKGDAYLFDMTYERSPQVWPTQKGLLCRAVTYGGLDDVLDEVRARTVFDLLPSA